MSHFNVRFFLMIVMIQLIIHSTATNCAQGAGTQTCVGSNLECVGFESCLQDLFLCIDNQDCEVSCTYGSSSCRMVTINALQANSLTVNCGISTDGNNDQCKGMIVAANIDGDIQITCTGGQHMCSFSRINATGSDSLTIDCDSFESCQAMNIYCADDCYINCNNAQNNVCNGMSLTCGTGDCIIDCSGGGQKCISMNTFDISQTSNFQCIGTSSECSVVNNNLITGSPTSTTTTTKQPSPNPTSFPTEMPTSNPTFDPTLDPTTSMPTTVLPTTDIPTTNIPTTDIPTTNIPTTDTPTTNTPTTNFPTAATTISALTPNPTTIEPSSMPSITTTLTTLTTLQQSTITPTKSGAEGGVDVETTLELRSSTENLVNNNSNFSWIYIATILAFILICVGGILIWKKKRKANNVLYYFGSRSAKVGEGNKKNNTHLVDTNMVNNIMMDDALAEDIDIDEYETPMGNESTHIEMYNRSEGYGEMIINDEDETPSGDIDLLHDKEVIGNDMITSGNDHFDKEGTDPEVDDIDDTMQNHDHMTHTVQ